MKRLFSVLMVIAFLAISLPTAGVVLATSMETQEANPSGEIAEETILSESVYSEGLQYVERKGMTDEELKEQGLSDQQIEEIRSLSYEERLLERASYSDEQLTAMGYTSEQIQILREYDGSPLTETSAVLEVLPACTGVFKFVSYETDIEALYFKYEFTWSSEPVSAYTDVMAVSWRAFDSQAYEIAVSPMYLAATIKYYGHSSGVQEVNQRLSTSTPIPGINGYQVQFNVLKAPESDDNTNIWLWAKKGTFSFALQVDGNNTISTLKAYGMLGHSMIDLGMDFSVGYTSSGTDYTFTFTATEELVPVAIAHYRIKPNGTCQAIP